MKKTDAFMNWWKKDKRYLLFGKALLMALLPFLCCLVSCAVSGKNIGDVYLPSSEWNDELFYYKQVESIVRFGYPLGYYGFNESHGLVLSFAAWSPALVLPWIGWGLLFGWNLMSPIVCNILLMTLAVFLFVLLAAPSWKQMGILTFLFCLYTPFVRYMLSGMPEIICISHLIVFYGLVYSYFRKEKMWKIICMFLFSWLLTLMRPYMLLFLMLPAVLLVWRFREKKKTWIGCCLSVGIVGVVLVCYALIKHYFGAEYFHPLFFTDWITTFFTDGFGAGVHNFFSTLYWKGKDFKAHTVEGIRSGLASGAFFAGYLATLAVLLWQSAADMRKYRKSQEKSILRLRGQLIAEAHLAISFIGMFFALLLMYKLTEGSKHLLTFMAVGVFVVSLMDTRFFKKAVFLGAVFAYLYSYMAIDPYDYQVPYVTAQRQAQVEEWRTKFADNLSLERENVPNFDNVVIWVFNEQSDAGETMKWQLLYAVPEGFGISCCQKDFVLGNFGTLQSGYIAAQTGAEVDEKCAAAGWTLLAKDQDMVLYQRPDRSR